MLSLLCMKVLSKWGRTEERVRDYILVEDVQKGWEPMEDDLDRCHQGRGSQRILDMNEKVLLAENKWKGSGRFLLKKTTNVSGAIASFFNLNW